MSEQALQKDILDFFQNPIIGLDYEIKSASIVNPDKLIIKKDIVEWFTKGSNKKNWDKIVQKNGNEDRLIDELVDEIDKRVMESRNAALFFYSNSTIYFKGFPLYTFIQDTSDHIVLEYANRKHMGRNIFSVVEEFTYKKSHENQVKIIRPDLCFFINGIYIGYQELKHNFTGQSSSLSGRKKVAQDYCSFIYFVNNTIGKKSFSSDEDFKVFERRTLQLFSQAISISAYDLREFFIIRGIDEWFNKNARNVKNGDNEDVKSTIIESFKKFSPPKLFGKSYPEKWQWIYASHFGKYELQNEFIYYNFLEGSDIEKGTRKKLIGPRPKQKYAVDKCMDRVIELVSYDDENFVKNEILSHPSLMNLSDEQKEKIISKMEKLKANESIYSLLLQYAAGFGKTNIIGWLSLRLKDLTIDSITPVFDKILLVSDRLDLREQLNQKMMNMNADKAEYAHADNKESLKKALKDRSRIIIVNIQKFSGNIKELFSTDMIGELNKQRVAILIDEIHRSNTGSQHENMLDSFTDIHQGADAKNKNLIIGLTATPTDESLLRFGEFISPPDQFEPFDTFTMKEAQEEKFVLNPVENLRGCQVIIDYEMPDDEESATISKNEIYNNRKRINLIAKKATEVMFRTTFPKIGGRAKAMFACHSVEAAIAYYDAFKHEFEKYRHDKEFHSYRNASISVVYSNKQGQTSSESIMEKSEHEVIKEFKSKSNKNGLIIVVKKLQTGFDEPRIHTLFLDREVKDIEAVQTACRVNRTTEGKDDCLVFDFSHDNVNLNNIKEAFDKFTGIKVNDINVDSIDDDFIENVKFIFEHEIAKLFYQRHKKLGKSGKDEADFANDVIDCIESSEKALDEFKKYKYALSQYLEFYENYKLVLKIKPEYVTYPRLRYAWRMHSILSYLNSDKKSGEVVGIDEVSIGVITDDSGNIIESNETKNNKPSSSSDLNVSYSKFLKECEKEEMKRLSLEEYLKKLHFVFDFIEKENYQKFVNLIKSDKRLDEYEKIVNSFEKSFNMCARKPINKKEVGHDFFRLLKPYLNVILHEFEEYIS